jgi:outer membrane protein TolC
MGADGRIQHSATAVVTPRDGARIGIHARKDATANDLLGELAENLAAIEAARRQEQLVATTLLPQAQMTFSSALASYENGQADFAMLLEAQQQIRKARLSQIKAQAEAQVRVAEIERLLGEDL